MALVTPTSFAVIAVVAFSFGSATIDKAAAQEAARTIPELEWNKSLKNFNFDNDKFIGQRFTARCPPHSAGDKDPAVHGSGSYPSKSAICVAAVHAGKIGRKGGIVIVQLNPGASSYKGSSRNGVKSANLPGSRRSMVFLDAKKAATSDKVRLAHVPRLKWTTKFTSTTFARKMYTGQRFALNCPAAPGNLKPKYIFGTDSYAFHSVVCVAAVHAGKITKKGGLVFVQIDPGKDMLVGSIRNGIESKDMPTVHHTISFVDRQP